MSNAVLISGAKTQTGHPIAVFGPQTSYYMPQLLVEKDVHGPGIDARGAAFAGTDLYVQLGRGTELRLVGDVGRWRQHRHVRAQAVRARRRHSDDKFDGLPAQWRLRADRDVPAHAGRQAQRGRRAFRP